MELVMQIISTDKGVRNDTIQDLKEFNSQSLSSQAKKGEQMTDDIVKLHTENESLKNKIGTYDEKWLEESETTLLQQIDGEKRVNSILPRLRKQMNK